MKGPEGVQQSPISMLEFVERRTALLVSLSEALSAASASVVGFDLEGLAPRIAEQERLCAEIAGLDRQVDAVQKRLGQSASPGLAAATERLRAAQRRVQFQNASHQRLLERSRRTVHALLRSYETFAADLYENPASRHAGGAV